MYEYMPNGLLYVRDMIHEWWMMSVVGDLACEMSMRFETKGSWYKYEARPQTHWGGDDQRYGFGMWLIWGLNFKGWYGIGNII